MKNLNIITRSSYTFFESILTIDSIVSFAKKNNYSYSFLVDKNVMYGAFEFYKKAKKENIKPILGLEIDYQGINKIFFAKNYEGYKKLMTISSLIMTSSNIDEDLLLDKNLIEITEPLSISSYTNDDDIETFRAFSKIGEKNVSIKNTSLSSKKNHSHEVVYDYLIKNVDFEIPKINSDLPHFETGKQQPKELLQDLLKKSLEHYLKTNSVSNKQEYIDRMVHEYKVIVDKKFENYFLIVWDFIKWAKQNKIMVGPGRGSAGGSLVSFLLHITDVDPIKNNLYFERFLNVERIKMPDIDIDIEDTRREEVIQYIQNKYGIDYVAQIITFQTLRAKMSIRDIAKVFDIPNSEVEKLSKVTPEFDSLEESYKNNKVFRMQVDTNSTFKKIYESAKLIEGLPRQFSTHAAGIVLSNRPLRENVPVQKGHMEIYQTQYSMDYLEENGLLKIDLLGLRNLTFIKETLKLIESRHNTTIDLEKISFDDKKVLNVLAKGQTSGIFQLESPGMTKLLQQLKVDTFEDIVASTSLFRPGPQKNIPSYIARKHGKEKIEYYSPILKPILEKTYGIIVYQEQIMEIAKVFAGFTLAKSDILRNAISKKITSEIDRLKNDFFEGATKNGHSKEVINEIYELIYKFAEYGFNRSHAFAYSVISYQLTYLKCYYPVEFMTSLLSSIIGSADKTFAYIHEAIQMGIKVLKPSINDSMPLYSIADKNSIRMPILTLKGVGIAAIKEIYADINGNGKYSDFVDFITRINLRKVSKTNIESLIKSGALDEFGLSRSTMIENYPKVITYAELITVTKDKKSYIDKTLLPPFRIVESKNKDSDLWEKDIYGFSFDDFNKKPNVASYTGDQDIVITNQIIQVKQVKTKTGAMMAFVSIKDKNDSKWTFTVWPAQYGRYLDILQVGKRVKIISKLDETRDNFLKLISLEEA